MDEQKTLSVGGYIATGTIQARNIEIPLEKISNALDIRVKKLYVEAELPKYETTNAAGFDLKAYLEDGVPIELPPAKTEWNTLTNEFDVIPSRALIKTGLAFAVPAGYELQVRSRSGLALKKGIQAHVGTVDADYRGEVGVILFNFGAEYFTINHGDRIAQAVINRIEQVDFLEVDELDETERGAGGFGSTGV